jgi:hypothetical protein
VPEINDEVKEMSETCRRPSRRRFIRIAIAGAAAAPLATLFGTNAAAADNVSETNPQAAALKYRQDATKAPERKDPKAVCENCNFFSGKPGAASGPCSIFAGNLVTAKGWCTAWVKKA